MRRVLVFAMLVCVGSAVGCGSSPTSPSTFSSSTANSSSSSQSLAGNYVGSITITYATVGGSVTCPASTSVTQVGSTVTIGAITPSGACEGVGATPALGSFTIDNTGSLGTLTATNVPDSSCNGAFNQTITGGFSGTTLQFSFVFTAVSGGCLSNPGSFTISGTLTQQ